MSRLAILFALFLTACQTRLPWDAPATHPGVRVQGNTNVHTGDLLDAARDELDAFTREGKRDADADDAAYAMEALLRERGHPDAKVAFETTPQALVFDVKEGPLAEMGRVSFEGVTAVPESKLRPFFDFSASGFLGTGPVLYQDFAVSSAMSDVEALYLGRGHHRVEVGPAQPAWNESRTCMNVVIPVDEGPVYTLAAIQLDGLPERYLDSSKALVNGPFRARQTVVIAGNIRKQLYEEGYAFADVRARAEVDDDAASAVILVTAKRGAQTRIGRICIHGQRRTKQGFLRKQLRLRPGALLQRGKLNEGVGRMYSTGVLRAVRPELKEVRPGLADVDIEVEEGRARSIDARVGWGSWEQLMGSVTYRDLNFLGRARALEITPSASIKGQGLDVIVEDPWILGDETFAFVKGTIYRREEPFYDYHAVGFSVGVERRFGRRLTIRGGYQFNAEEAENIRGDLSQAVQDIIGNFSRSAGLYAIVRRDTRDDPFLPTQGSLLVVSTFWSASALGANLPYFELDASAADHIPLGNLGVVMLGGRFATRKPLEGLAALPIQRRYFLGGSETVRSFFRSELTPVDAQGNGLGGRSAAHATLEFRRGIYQMLHGALFADVGWVSTRDFDIGGAFGYGIGAGLRYYLPIGPLRLDAAYNPGDLWAASRRWQLHLSFGFNF